ncbi:UDP-N-acetylmuramoyl-L-alanyl-D-glutamate--2,6-diaminopimelate ligase [Halocella sp. SP3-1]|uniref:UDP-N-acetylmuramoyl-L-alanyl-D-glutamate--2, 6-diaminopimelate ligase n=1 Tax=Halocella sp. SP3-1 TaxID=2382161 RepID=UPI000F761E71|nr:UDP-N-acetylmuramoyl-L-alanyl-D-glutamate--2,6-diaminopimelate ligase [Halocella sp. SP3-1]AZO95088.1 UDP-N-acetylmuramoyl-L-alanyl-D-glutamate--2,6-diaminopimelate ligase [Halocella sp. SP3-1]
MKIKELLVNVQVEKITGDENIEISGMVYDSRQAKQGDLFICIDGFRYDGHNFIPKAVQNGVCAVVIEREVDEYIQGITYIRVKSSREAMASLAASFYNYPLDKLQLIGVTGTNGKTTTTYLIKSILEQAGLKTGLIGTIKNIIADKTLPATRTTPESLDLYQLYDKMLKEGITHVVMEVSSHALDLKRVKGMEFAAAVFTNITQDHLDYHKSIEEYLKAKCSLFKQLTDQGTAIINIDDNYSNQVIESASARVISYGINKKADLSAEDIQLSPKGASFLIRGRKNIPLSINLTGEFNVYNTLAAVGVAVAFDIDDDSIKRGLEGIPGVAGRFELINESQGFSVVVDYAHTPDGMENVLKTALEFVKGKIIVVFGCGGDRDEGKRPLMGKMAASYGDYAVLTSDNPRSEDPLTILAAVEKGVLDYDSETPYIVLPDRREAIFHAISRAGANDMVIIFGKGHETYQIFKDKTISFDDREVAREAIKEKMADDKK